MRRSFGAALALALLFGCSAGGSRDATPLDGEVDRSASHLTTPTGADLIVLSRPPARTTQIFGDAYAAPFIAEGWGSVETLTTATKVEGTTALAVTLQQAWSAFGAGVTWGEAPYAAASQTELSFAFNAGPTVDPGLGTLRVGVDDDDPSTPVDYVALQPYVGPMAPSTWYRVTIPMAALNPSGRPLRRMLIANYSDRTSVPFLLDDVKMTWTDPQPTVRAVYTDAAEPGFSVGGWSVSNAADGYRTTGAAANRATYTAAWGALTFVWDWNAPAFAADAFSTVSFDISPGPGTPPAAMNDMRIGLDTAPTKFLTSFIPGGFKANTWHRVTIPVAALSSGPFRMVTFKNESPSTYPFYVDNVRLETDHAPPPLRGEPPSVQFIGRFDTRDAEGPICGWPGCRIVARFDGPSVAVSLDERAYAWMQGGPSEWDVAIDDVWQDKLVTTPGVHSYPLRSGLGPGAHKVELYRRSEAQNGFAQFRGFEFSGGTLLAPPARSSRRIEIVGDSQPAAFGVEGVGYPNNDCPGLDYAARWENFHKSFGAILGATVGAEVFGTAYSGKGIVKNVWRPDTETMPVLFSRSNPVDAASSWDFASWQPDVLIMMIGANDFAFGQPDESGGNGPPTPAEFTNAYRAFVQTIRTKYPSTHLFLSVTPGASDAEPAGRNTRSNLLATTMTVANERNAAGDARVYALSPNIASPAELTGCNGHGTPAFHQRVAAEYATLVKQKAGW